MLWEIVTSFMGSLPEEFQFMYIFGVIFVLYILISLFKFFIDLAFDFCKSFF